MHASSAYGPEDLIAIVGMAGRFPGAPDTDSLWTLLMDSREAIVPVPERRWDTSRPLDPERDIQAVGGFLDGVENFDAGFFGISPREAAAIDPQQRLMLETGWRALEDAGQRADDLAGSRTGVYVGASWHDYELLRIRHGARPTPHSLVGNALDVIAARLSYFLRLRGPSMAVETGCSSSLVALHLAAQALRQGDVDAAVVGGVNLMMDPHVTIGLTHFGGLSPDGRSKAFSAHANGFVRGEGVAALYVKTLARALADGDRVHAVVARTVVNNDGGGDSLVTPSPEGQRDLLTRAYLGAGAPVGAPAYIEAHGTGTGRGDPIEATAIGEVLGVKRASDDPLHIGSVKTNIGHLEACAGMAGLFKLLLALRHRTIPPSLHAQDLNPAIAFDELGLRVAREPVRLPADGPLYVGVNSFGWGGTNAHVVLTTPPLPADLEAPGGPDRSADRAADRAAHPAGTQSPAPAPAPTPAAAPAAPATGLPPLLALSAKERPVLAQRARELLDVLPPDVAGLTATAATLARRRDHFPVRAAVVADPAGTAMALRALADRPDADAEAPGLVLGRAVPRGRVAFVFPGQGSQWKTMGRALYRDSPLFAGVIRRCAQALRPHCDWDLLEIFADRAGDEWTTRIDMLQPTLWAMSLGLAELWRAAGIEPDVVLGHSQGEITAATVAGILDYDDAALVMARRSAIARRASGKGRMLAVDLGRDAALAALEGFEDTVSLAVHNGPTSCVLSGDEESVLVLKELLEADGTYCRLVNVDYASHSPQMDPLREDLLAALAPVGPRPGHTELMSTVRARPLEGGEMDAAYWVENLRSPVRFADAMGTLLAEGVTHVVEISPHPVLAPAVEQLAAQREEPVAVLTTLRRDRGEAAHMALALARGYTGGLEPFADLPAGVTVPVPGYPLRADAYWPQERRGAGGPARGFDAPPVPVPGDEGAWQAALELSLVDQPWLADHRVHGTPVLPGAATLSIALDLVRRHTGAVPTRLENVAFERGVTLHDGVTRLAAHLREDIAGGAAVTLLSLPDGGGPWQPNATARVETRARRSDPPRLPAWAAAPPDEPQEPQGADAKDTGRTGAGAAEFYGAWAARGLEYGSAFQGVRTLRRPAPGVGGPEPEVLGEVVLADRLRAANRPGTLHPALWDSALQVALALFDDTAPGTALVPTAIRRVEIHNDLARPVTAVRSYAVRRADGLADVTVHTTDGDPLLAMYGVDLRPLAVSGDSATAEAERSHRLEWTAAPCPATDPAEGTPGVAEGARQDAMPREEPADGPVEAGHASDRPVVGGSWAVVGDRGLARELGAALAAAGARVTDDGDDADAAAVVFAAPPAGAGRAVQREALAELAALAPRLADRTAPPALTVVTVGAQAARPADLPDPGGALFWGFGRVLRREHPELATRLVDMDGIGAERAAACVPLLAADDAEDQTALRDGRRLAARLTRGDAAGDPGGALPPVHTPPQPFVYVAATGGAAPVAVPLDRRAPGEGRIEIEVSCAALSGSCAGRVVATGPGSSDFAVGERVVACGIGMPASHVTVPAALAKHVPDGLDDVDAAPLALALATAGYALAHLGRLDAGESVLVHVAGDPAAMAAVKLARVLGARVLATATDEDARAYLAGEGVTDVYDSADPAWPRRVRAATGDEGVDLMVGLPSGTAPDTAAGALAAEGRLIVLDGVTGRHGALRRGLTFSSVDVASLLRHAPARFVRALEAGWTLIERGAVSPLPVVTRVFPEAVSAAEDNAPVTEGGSRDARDDARTPADVRTPDGARTPDGGPPVPPAPRTPGVTVLTGPSTAPAVTPVPLPGGRLRAGGSYLITGGLGELGLSLAAFMAGHGAGRLVLLGRSAPGPDAAAAIARLREDGTDVQVVLRDVADRQGMADALDEIRGDGAPLRGVVHAAGVLADATVRTLTRRQLDLVLAPKLDGATHLDELTAADPLDFFVLFSSAAGLLGNAGQAAYAAANTAMDALAQARRRRGRPALSVQWGPFTGIGLAARDEQRGDRLAERGMGGFPPAEAWPALLRMLDRGDTVTGYVPISPRQWFDAYPDTAALGSWQLLRAAARDEGAASGGEFLAGLRRAAPDERPALAERKVRELAGRIMRLDSDRVGSDTPFKALGLDSLMSLELRNRLESAFGLKLSPTLLWAHSTPHALAGALCGLLPEPTDAARPDDASS